MENNNFQYKYNRKYKNRKARYTFPNELDDVYDKPSRHKHRRRTYTYSITEHNCDDVVRITEYIDNDRIYKKVVIQKYNKTHPEIQEEDTTTDTPSVKEVEVNKKTVVSCLSAVIIKILCILGIISVI